LRCASLRHAHWNIHHCFTRRLLALVKDRYAPQKHPWRAEIVLLGAGGAGTNVIIHQTGKSKTCVWRWQQRFATEGFEGLLRDKTRSSRIKPLGDEVAARIVALTLDDPIIRPARRRTGPASAPGAPTGFSRIACGKLSNDPKFVDKLRDVVGLYVDPPTHAMCFPSTKRTRFIRFPMPSRRRFLRARRFM
jgi:hypothetical protein